MELRTLLKLVVIKRPPRQDSKKIPASLELDYKIFASLLHFLFQILDYLTGVLAEIDIYPLRFGLQDTVFISNNKSHPYSRIYFNY